MMNVNWILHNLESINLHLSILAGVSIHGTDRIIK